MSGAPNSVSVSVPARLHLGFLDLNGGRGRMFGSIGMAISGLETRVNVVRASQWNVSGCDPVRASDYVARMRAFLKLPHALHVDVDAAVPGHAGLGSGTQLALAIAAAVRRINGIALDVRGDAFRLGRGRRSGVGIGLFDSGGVVVDGGRSDAPAPAPVVSRLPLPESWRVIVVLDPGRAGVHGEAEIAAFARLSPFPADDAAHICRLVLMQALPALAEADIVEFGAAIKDMQHILGDYFAPLQGGARFTSPAVAAALDLIESEGGHGIGQSSWGPTGFAFAPSQSEAERLVALARKQPACAGLDIRACKGLNRGAEIHADTAARAARM